MSIHLAWEHELLTELLGSSSRYDGSYCEIAVADGEQTHLYNETISRKDKDPNGDDPYTQPQNHTVPVRKGSNYTITLTPIYPVFQRFWEGFIPFETRCERQSISFKLYIPPETAVEQVGEDRVRILSGGVSSGYQVTLLNQNGSVVGESYRDDLGSRIS